MTLKEAIAASFQTLEAVVPNYPRGELETRAMVAWLSVLEAERVTPEELEKAVVLYLRTGRFMPTPSEVMACVCKANPCSLILDPVKTGEHMGTDEIGSRERCEAKGLPFVELREDGLPALPAEVRESALARLESLEKKALKRVRPSRERSGFDAAPDPEAQERARRMVESVRREG